MSSRRNSTMTSLQGSNSGSPTNPTNEFEGDTSMADTTTGSGGGGLEKRESSENTIGESVHSSSYIQRSPLLDIAFLHSISTHRPLGPHKHFNLIPVLTFLDRTVRQIGARMRDGSVSEPPEEEDGEEGDSDVETDSKRRPANDRSRSTSRRAIKKEEEEDNVLMASSVATTSIPIDGEMVWQRLNELYDVDGLEELEDAAVDSEEYSPFIDAPPPSIVSIHSRKSIGDKIKAEPIFGFGSSLIKLPESNQTNQSSKSSVRQQKKSKRKTAQEDEDEDEDDDRQISEFQLGPWEEYEDLIAPRRLKAYAPEEANNSESDGELSEPSVETKPVERNDEEEDEEKDDDEDEGEEDEEDEDGEDEDDDEEEEEEEEEAEEEEEEEDKRSSKRKSVASHSNKRAPAASRQKRGNAPSAAAAAAASSSPSAATSTRTSRSSVKPRRSGRR